MVREVALAVEDCVGAERTYLYSLGSQRGNEKASAMAARIRDRIAARGSGWRG